MTEQTLAQEIALVTGASRGIGRAIAIELARRGATVVGSATSEAGAQGITQSLAEAGKVRGIVLNVADPQSIDAALKNEVIPAQKPSMGCNIKWKPGNGPA